VRGEQERGQERALQALHLPLEALRRAAHLVDGAPVGVVLAVVVREVRPHVLDPELRLAAGVEPVEQALEPRLLRHHDDLVEAHS
jgi:hypothetical protein